MSRTFLPTSVVALLLVASATVAGAATRFVAVAPTTLVLEGSSNVSSWRCRGTSVDVQTTVAAPIEKINAVIDRIEDGNVGVWMANPSEGKFPPPEYQMVIPIAAFRCGNPVMDRDMRHA